jgi:hypothetical protein
MSLARPVMNFNLSSSSLVPVARDISCLKVVTYSATVLICARCVRRVRAAKASRGGAHPPDAAGADEHGGRMHHHLSGADVPRPATATKNSSSSS